MYDRGIQTARIQSVYVRNYNEIYTKKLAMLFILTNATDCVLLLDFDAPYDNTTGPFLSSPNPKHKPEKNTIRLGKSDGLIATRIVSFIDDPHRVVVVSVYSSKVTISFILI